MLFGSEWQGNESTVSVYTFYFLLLYNNFLYFRETVNINIYTYWHCLVSSDFLNLKDSVISRNQFLPFGTNQHIALKQDTCHHRLTLTCWGKIQSCQLYPGTFEVQFCLLIALMTSVRPVNTTGIPLCLDFSCIGLAI